MKFRDLSAVGKKDIVAVIGGVVISIIIWVVLLKGGAAFWLPD